MAGGSSATSMKNARWQLAVITKRESTVGFPGALLERPANLRRDAPTAAQIDLVALGAERLIKERRVVAVRQRPN
jgi:hypothetical protein